MAEKKAQNAQKSKPKTPAEQIKHLRAANKKLREDRDFLLGKFNEKRTEREEMLAELRALKLQNADLQKSMAQKEQTILLMRQEVNRSKAEVQSYVSSSSWRMTAPLRAVVNIFRRG